MRRVIYLVFDGVGVGELPDARSYGDEGADTLGNLSKVIPLKLPTLQALGLGNIAPIMGVAPVDRPQAIVGRLAPLSIGKDTTVGHWEQMGHVTETPFPTYPHGFPSSLISEFSARIGRGVLGNRPASGTKIIAEMGDEHVATGRPIVYTSADSVFQVAAHVDVVPLQTLYDWCETARDLLAGPHAVARVIARPFRGDRGSYVRTPDRKDFSLEPPGRTYLDELQEEGQTVVALGKIGQIFAHRGISISMKVSSNEENLALVTDLVAQRTDQTNFDSGLLVANLADFDSQWGHRNDAQGFALGLTKADAALAALVDLMRPEDLLVLTADHGVDPTTTSTDHSREYVPLLVYPRPAGCGDDVFEGEFADAGATAYAFLTDRQPPLRGASVFTGSPSRGWRRYTPMSGPSPGESGSVPCRVGEEEVEEATAWLRERLGAAPTVAVILGSGLRCSLGTEAADEIPYDDIPHWRVGHVTGHGHTLRATNLHSAQIAMLAGRVHEYEGFDSSEVQLPVRTLARWGVRTLILTTASGGVTPDLSQGDFLICTEVLDLIHRDTEGRPVTVPATSPNLREKLRRHPASEKALKVGIHASLPGPQYETAAELALLESWNVATVSMSPATELHAALAEGMQVATLAAVTNVGDTDHAQVLATAGCCSNVLDQLLAPLLDASL